MVLAAVFNFSRSDAVPSVLIDGVSLMPSNLALKLVVSSLPSAVAGKPTRMVARTNSGRISPMRLNMRMVRNPLLRRTAIPAAVTPSIAPCRASVNTSGSGGCDRKLYGGRDYRGGGAAG